MKIRSDQRLYGEDLFNSLCSLIQAFPLNKNSDLLQRIIVTSLNSFMHRTYSVSDMVMFGNTKDLLLYWDIDYYHIGVIPYLAEDKKPINSSSGKPILAEVYLFLKFMENIKIQPTWTNEQYWQICRDHFIFVDSSMLDLYWPKFSKEREYRFSGPRVKNYKHKDNVNKNIGFLDWLQLYVNRGTK
jgi:hypothetical protein